MNYEDAKSLAISKNMSQLVLDIWVAIRVSMGKSDEISLGTRGPTGRPLALDLARYEAMLARGGAFGAVKRTRSEVAHTPTRPVLRGVISTNGRMKETSSSTEKSATRLSMAQLIDNEPLTGVTEAKKTATPTLRNSKIKRDHENLHALYMKNYDHREDKGLSDLDALDLAIADVHEDFPWLAKATETVWLSLRRQIKNMGCAQTFPALLLLGPPGVGKTTWAQRMSSVLKLGDMAFVDAASSPSGMTLAGLESGWSTAQPGIVVHKMLKDRMRNPVVIVDELDKAGAVTSRGTSVSIISSLLGMMGPASKSWVCPFYGENFDMSRVSWILTANDLSQLPSWILSRTTVIDVPYPNEEEILSIVNKNCLSDEVAKLVVDEVRIRFSRSQNVTPRLVERMIEKSLNSAARPEMNG